MDRTANPLFKAGMAAITATTLVVAPTVAPPTRQAISLPDIRSTTVRLSSLAFTPQSADVPVSPLAALKLPLSPPAAAAAGASTLPRTLTPISPLTSAIQPRAAAPAPTGAAAQPRPASASATAGPAVANSITNGIDQAYQFVQYWVDYGVNLAQWGAGFVPVIGGLVSAQIGIVYDNLVRPIANSFVYNLVDPIINDPSFSNIVNSFGRFGGDIVNSVINLAWAEVRYFLPPLPPLPGLALQATTPADAAASATVHEALAPFAKAFKDAEAHFAEALGLTKTDPKLTTAEKAGTATQTSTESGKEPTKEISKEDGRTTEAAGTTGATETPDSKESSDGKTPAKDKTVPAVEKQASDKPKADGKETAIAATEVTKETVKDTPKEGATSTDAAGTSGEPVKTSKPVKETEDQKDSTKETTPAIGATTVDKQDKTVKAKVPTASTTEHGAISAQGIVRGPVSQSTTSGQPGSSAPAAKSTESKVSEGKTSDTQRTDAAAPDTKIAETKTTDTKNTGTKTADTKTTDTKTSDTKTTDSKPKASETKSSESKTSNTKSSGTASAHDSASKSSGSGSNSSKSGGEGSKSGGGSHH